LTEVGPGSVWLDARGAQSEAHGDRGVGRYIVEQLGALLELAPEVVGAVGLDPSLPTPASLEPLAERGLLASHADGPAPGRPAPSIYHVMSPFETTYDLEGIWPGWARDGARLVVTLYDLIPLVFRQRYLEQWGGWTNRWMGRLGLIGSADQVLTISQNTADDAMRLLEIPEGRVTVVDCGVSDEISSLVPDEGQAVELLSSELRGVRPGFLLYVGGDDPRKNMEGTIRAYAQLSEAERQAHQLVIVCRIGRLRRLQLRRFARELGIGSGELVLTGYVSDRELAALYRTCALFVFPSEYEGAGLPILEAMTCGAPVAASGVSSIPELLGDDDATFDPADPADIARCISEVIADPGRLESLRERSQRRVGLFTWERVAERTLEGYRS
jgi:glycosyltransferase involved in cell wall biosynthesis